MNTRKLPALISVIAAAQLFFLTVITSYSASPLVLDGQFNDWVGRERITDNSGDADENGDIRYFYWGTNDGEGNLYFMVERYSAEDPGDKVTYTIRIDTNNDGNFGSSVDRVVEIEYNPNRNNSSVKVEVLRPNGTQIAQYNGDWGQSVNEGALKVEVRVTFANLGISANQTIRLYMESDEEDRAPDSGNVQMSPIPILDYPILAVVVAAVVFLVWWKAGRFAWRSH